MTTYNTYQEAKIANPELEVYKLIDKVGFVSDEDFGDLVRLVHQQSDTEKCNPADYCMTVEKFLDSGYFIEKGDLFLNEFGKVSKMQEYDKKEPVTDSDKKRFILRAAALEEKKPHAKVEYVKVSAPCDFFDLKSEFRGEELSFINGDGDYEAATTLVELVTGFDNMNLYRRIETPITEREAFIEVGIEILKDVNPYALGKLFDSGKFKLVN
jgi:hypothetical protein